ncbi:MAG: tetratricopeptide repeat protein [Deltaproteobacteria bacterium]
MALATAAATRAAHAQDIAAEPTEPRVHVGWSDASDPARPAAERELVEAHLALRRLLARRAALDGSARALITDARLHELTAQLGSISHRAPALTIAWLDLADVAFERRDGEAMLGYLREAETRAGDGPLRVSALTQLGIAFTLLDRFADARGAYRAALEQPQSTTARGVSLCNLAEIETYLREAEASIMNYEACVALLPGYDGGYWGLASALDREGRDREARDAAQRAISIDPGAASLTSHGVFYTPPYEVHYYLGLAREAQGRPAEALAAWRRYLDLGGASDPWAHRARAHIEALSRPRRTVRR